MYIVPALIYAGKSTSDIYCCNIAADDEYDLIHSGEDGKVLDEFVDDDEEDGGGGKDDEQPHLVPFIVLGGDHSGTDGDKEAGGKGDLQCEPVGGTCLCYKVRTEAGKEHPGN